VHQWAPELIAGAAGAGSLILEFAVLSRLTGDLRFEVRPIFQSWPDLQDLAKKAYLAIWNRRSAHNLLGNTIGALHGHWLIPGLSGVGAGLDSFFEYGIKAAILLSELRAVWERAQLTRRRRCVPGYLSR
jgi:mannosidase alpha-like ER degradation enhancer 1